MANPCDSIVVDLTPQNVQVDMWQSPDYVIGLKSYVYNLQFQAAGMGPPGPQGAPGKDSTVPGPPGAPGSQGLPGPPGIAATCNVGSTATLTPGSAATVSNVGTSSAAVFNFGIPSGLTGATGAQGNQGVQGNPGPPLNPKGNVASWSNLPTSGNQAGDLWTTNDTGHGWAWNGTAWVDLGQWQGVQGIQGSAATIAAGTTSTLVAGSNATVTNVGSSSAAVFNFGIPAGIAGATGATGATGSPGAAATIAVGTTTTGAAGTSASVTNSGSSSAAVFNFTIPQGIQGATGATGAPGSAATIAVGTTSTLTPGSNATVSNSGSSNAAIFNFGIPAGIAGATGPAGPSTPSANTGNLLTTGSDNLLYLPASQIQPTIWSSRLRSFNAIGNPSFEVDQRNVGNSVSLAAGSTAALVCDRWSLQKNTATAVMTGRQALVSGTLPVVPGTNFLITRNNFNIGLTTAQATLAAGEYIQLIQNIEGPFLRELINDVHSISVLVWCNQAPITFTVRLSTPAATYYTLTKLCTISTANQWTLFTLPNLPIFTSSGSWPTAPGNAGYTLGIGLGAGSTYTSPANDTWQAGNFVCGPGTTNFASLPTTTILSVAFVQHEPGPLCTTLIDKPWQQNYDECLRYYQKSYDYATVAGTVTQTGARALISFTSASAHGPGAFHKPMAKVPTVTLYNHATGAANSVQDNASVNHASAAAAAIGLSGFGVITFTTATTSAMPVWLQYVSDSGL